MELLQKTVVNSEDRRKDNSDKKELFAKERHPHTADFYKKEWSFIQDSAVRDNISYQLQYLEFMIRLYNDYQLYLTTESLLCKDIMVLTGGIIEAALFDLIHSAKQAACLPMIERTDFTVLLGTAFHEYGFLDKDLWHFFHNLRKVRNNVHLTAADFKEHTAYTIEQANEYVNKLEEFRKNIGRKTVSI
jgi:hypothetical protein